MSYLNSCNICYKEFKDSYTIWNQGYLKHNTIFQNIYKNNYNSLCNYFIFYNFPPRIICFTCHEYYNVWEKYSAIQKLNYICYRHLGKKNNMKCIKNKNKNKKTCVLCSKKISKPYFFKNMFNVQYLGPLCFNCFQ